ncbi:MAG: PAS domain S-box protein, partial [bacterium]
MLKIKKTGIKESVIVPKMFKPVFDQAQKTVGQYFKNIQLDPSKGSITIGTERYVLVRSSALSINFLNTISALYSDRSAEEALSQGRNILFDIAHILGLNDAKEFHLQMGLKDPVAKLSAGPVHFSHTGWALVKLLPGCNPTSDKDYYLIYDHPYSFEAHEWIKNHKMSESPVCIMNAGYSSGWCEQSFGIPLTAVEITCKAKGDKNCRFIMAPQDCIEKHVKKYLNKLPAHTRKKVTYNIPAFFERKQAEAALKQREERYRRLFEESNDAVFIFDLKGRITDVNRAACRLLGYDKASLNKLNISELHPRKDTESAIRLFNDIREKGYTRFEANFRKKEGTIIDIEISASIIDNDRGIIQGLVRDLTETNSMREQLRQSDKMRAIGQLAGGVAHDINNQMVSILGFSEILEEQLGKNDKKKYAQRIITTAKRASELTKQLLAFARKGKYQAAPVDINSIISEVIVIMRHTVHKRIKIIESLHKGTSFVNGDSAQLHSAFLNLAINANDAIAESGEILFSTRILRINNQFHKKYQDFAKHGKYLKIIIKDSGSGMTKEVKDRLFEPFFTTKKNSTNIGLGLSAVYGTVKN